jgi:hypothetical protein
MAGEEPGARASPPPPPVASADGDAAPAPPAQCLACRRDEIAYKCQPCGCPALCVSCARKMATGGRCKACKSLFAEVKRM